MSSCLEDLDSGYDEASHLLPNATRVVPCFELVHQQRVQTLDGQMEVLHQPAQLHHLVRGRRHVGRLLTDPVIDDVADRQQLQRLLVLVLRVPLHTKHKVVDSNPEDELI